MSNETKLSQDELNKKLVYSIQNNCFAGKITEIELLISLGADVNARFLKDRTPLMIASMKSCYPFITQLLIDNGADVNARDSRGYTALMLTAKEGFSPEVIAPTLVENGADITLKDKNGKDAWYYTTHNRRIYHTDARRMEKILKPEGGESYESIANKKAVQTSQKLEVTIRNKIKELSDEVTNKHPEVANVVNTITKIMAEHTDTKTACMHAYSTVNDMISIANDYYDNGDNRLCTVIRDYRKILNKHKKLIEA